MIATTKSRDSQYKVQVSGETFMTGDASSIGMIFGNLEGRNFKTRIGHEQTHADWLAYMGAEYETPLEVGMPIVMLNLEGETIGESTIGEGCTI